MSDKLRKSKIVKTWLRGLTAKIIDSSNHAITKHIVFTFCLFEALSLATAFRAYANGGNLRTLREAAQSASTNFSLLSAICLLNSSAIAQTSPSPPTPNLIRIYTVFPNLYPRPYKCAKKIVASKPCTLEIIHQLPKIAIATTTNNIANRCVLTRATIRAGCR